MIHSTKHYAHSPKLNCLLVGEVGVGKSALADCLQGSAGASPLHSAQTPTFLVRRLKTMVRTPKGGVELRIWDSQGGTGAARELCLYLAKCDIVVLVFDSSSEAATVAALTDWLDFIRSCYHPRLHIALIGNKSEQGQAVPPARVKEIIQALHPNQFVASDEDLCRVSYLKQLPYRMLYASALHPASVGQAFEEIVVHARKHALGAMHGPAPLGMPHPAVRLDPQTAILEFEEKRSGFLGRCC